MVRFLATAFKLQWLFPMLYQQEAVAPTAARMKVENLAAAAAVNRRSEATELPVSARWLPLVRGASAALSASAVPTPIWCHMGPVSSMAPLVYRLSLHICLQLPPAPHKAESWPLCPPSSPPRASLCVWQWEMLESSLSMWCDCSLLLEKKVLDWTLSNNKAEKDSVTLWEWEINKLETMALISLSFIAVHFFACQKKNLHLICASVLSHLVLSVILSSVKKQSLEPKRLSQPLLHAGRRFVQGQQTRERREAWKRSAGEEDEVLELPDVF